MTVGELRELLAKYDDSFLVHTEGCDCYGLATSVESWNDDGVLITRLD